MKKNPWTQQTIVSNNNGYGTISLLKDKYKLTSKQSKPIDCQLNNYKVILEQAKQIQEMKKQLASQIITQQFGAIIDQKQFMNRLQLLEQLSQIVDKVMVCLDQCRVCNQQDADNKQWISNDGSVFIQIPYQFKTQFLQILREVAMDKQYCHGKWVQNPDDQIIGQISNLRDVNKIVEQISIFQQSITELYDQLQ